MEHQIFSFGQMFSRDRCSTSYDLASLFRGRRSTLNRWNGKIAKRIGTRPSALHSLNFPFLKEVSESRRIASFLMLSTWKTKEVSQHCFVFDGVKFKIEEVSQSCCVLMLPSSKSEEVTQNSFVFEQIDRYRYRYRDRY